MKFYIQYKNFLIILAFLPCIGCGVLEYERSLNQGIYFYPSGLDPALNTESLEYQIFSQIYEPLLALENDYKTLKSCLAKSWEVSENKLSYIFDLKSKIKFHNGSLLSAEDVKYSFERQIKLRSDYPPFRIIEKITIIDSLKVRIDLKYPYTPFLYSLASPNGLVVMSKAALEKYRDEIKWHPVGTGSYMLDDWSKNASVTLKSFEEYRQEVSLKKIIFILPEKISDSDLLFSEGNLDILYTVSGYWLDRLKWLGKVKYYVQKPLNTHFIGFNVKNTPVDNILIRKAILSALDIKKSVLLINRGNADPAEGPLPPIYEGFSDLKQEGYDVSSAKMLMRESAIEKPIILNLYILSDRMGRKTIIELLKNQLEKIDVQLNLKYFNDDKSYDQAIRGDSCHLFFDGYGSELIGDPGNFLYALFHSSSKNNRMNYSNERVDGLIDKAFREVDDQKRHELYRRVVRMVIADTPAVFRAHVKSHFAYNPQKIESITISPYEFIYYHQLKLHN